MATKEEMDTQRRKSIRQPARLLALLCAFGLVVAGCAWLPPPATGEYWPTHGWRTSTPEAQGMDSLKLAQMLEVIRQEPKRTIPGIPRCAVFSQPTRFLPRTRQERLRRVAGRAG